MRFIKLFFSNYVIICSLIGWFGSSVMKIVIIYIKERRLDFRKIISSGGMPSAHSATVSALATAVAKVDGVDSVTFAIAFMFAFVVMYDASGVRRSAGEQAKLLNHIVQNMYEHKPIYVTKKLKEFIGHTPLEVVVGCLFGILIALLVPFRG